jgi:hypothetical protein
VTGSGSTDPSLATTVQAFFVVVGPGAGQRTFGFGATVLRIGRAIENDIVLDDPRVSRLHADVTLSNYRYVARDLGSRNGTLFNGVALSQPRPLQTGDVLVIADYELRFTDPASTAVSAAGRAPEPLMLNDATNEVYVEGQLIELAPKEYVLLRLLLQKAGELAGRDEIAQAVWPEFEGDVGNYNIDNLVARLRPKVERAGGPVELRAVRKRGYRLLVGGTH